MEIPLAPELEKRLNLAASDSGRRPGQIIEELITRYLEHDAWFRSQVDKGLASLDRGDVVSDDEVQQRIEHILRS